MHQVHTELWAPVAESHVCNKGVAINKQTKKLFASNHISVQLSQYPVAIASTTTI